MSTPEYVPIPSVGHELGIIFGFSGLMLVCMIAYYIGWKRYQKKIALVEEDRRRVLSGTPLYSGRFDEKGREKAEFVEDAKAGF